MTAAPKTDAEILARLRNGFPALRRRHRGMPVAYLDGPGGTQVHRTVVDAMSDYLLNHNANTHWNYPTSQETDELIEQARETLGDFLHADAQEIVFGANMTSLTFHLSRALGRGWGPGDEVVVTELDHHANIAPWQALVQERGITLRSVPFRVDDGTLDMEALEACVGPQTRLVAVGWASNALGTVNDVARIARLARAAGALSFIDAVHAAPHLLPDVQSIACDFLVCSPYKFYGPHLGVLFGRVALLESLDVPRLSPAPDTAPERLELGTLSHEAIVGAARAVEVLAGIKGETGMPRRQALELSYAWLQSRAEAQSREIWDGLQAIPGIRCVGPPATALRTPTVSFVTGMASGDVATRLANRGVFVSHGDFYAATVVERLGVEGLVRVGCSCFTDREIDQLLAALAQIVA